MESFGRLFNHGLRLYVCPMVDVATDQLTGIHELQLEPHLKHLYAYLLNSGNVKALETVKREYLSIYSQQVLEMIRNGSADWEAMVPAQVVDIIKEKKLFHWPG